MSFPQVAAENGGYDGNYLSHIVNLPTGIVAGNLLLVFFAAGTNWDGDEPIISFPVGWTILFQKSYQNPALIHLVRFSAAYKIATGGEGATITVNTNVNVDCSAHTSYRIISFAGVPEVGTGTAALSFPNPPNKAPSWGARDNLWFAAFGCIDSWYDIVSYPTNYTNGRYDRWDTATQPGVGVARRELNASSENPGIFTTSNYLPHVANTVVIRPVISYEKSISDTIGISDTITKAISLPKSDTVAITDSALYIGVGVGFHAAVAQRRYKSVEFDTFTFPDPAGVGFSSANDGYYTIAGFGIVHPSVKDIGLFRDETFTIAENESKAISVSKTDSITITDIFAKVSEFRHISYDGIEISDVLIKATEFYRTITDTVTITDSEGKSIEVTKADLITIADSIIKGIGLAKTDTLAIVDVEIKTIGKNLIDLIIITDGFAPIGVLFVPPGIYQIEIHDTDGSLVAILEKAFDISLEETVNKPKVVNFALPADEPKKTYMTRAREVWVRDVSNDTVIAKTKLLREEDARN